MHLILLWVNIAKKKPEALGFWFFKDLKVFGFFICSQLMKKLLYHCYEAVEDSQPSLLL